MATFVEVVNNQNTNKNNTDESDSKNEEQNKDYTSSDSIKPFFSRSRRVWFNKTR